MGKYGLLILVVLGIALAIIVFGGSLWWAIDFWWKNGGSECSRYFYFIN